MATSSTSQLLIGVDYPILNKDLICKSNYACILKQPQANIYETYCLLQGNLELYGNRMGLNRWIVNGNLPYDVIGKFSYSWYYRAVNMAGFVGLV